MDQRQRALFRVANQIANSVSANRNIAEVQLPVSHWQRVIDLQRRRRRAYQHGWLMAAIRVSKDLDHAIADLQQIVQALSTSKSNPTDAVVASTNELYRDLLALSHEFESVTVKRDKAEVAVTTENIELDGVSLGPFEIRLSWATGLGEHPFSYRVIATDPNPADADESVTHPHVQDEAVCEGDATQPIRTALRQGRIYDFFTIVANLLRTYNAGSPYVAISDWNGISCSDCGYSTSENERWSCGKCETTVCKECSYSCEQCDDVFCCECSELCDECNNRACNECLKPCAECAGNFCSECLNENERCKNCYENQTEEENTCGGDSDPAIQPHSVGKVAVLA